VVLCRLQQAHFHSSTGYDLLASLILNNIHPITEHVFDILLDMVRLVTMHPFKD
jgi:hypothetical protein